MNKTRIIAHTLFAVFCAIVIQTKSFAEPLNLNDARQNLRTYHDSGLYDQEITTIAAEADQYIVQQAELNTHLQHPKKLAIVLDIDETSLSYYELLSEKNFCYDPIVTREVMLHADAPAIKPVLKLYQDAIKHHVAVFFITGRYADLYDATVQNLKNAGYTGWTALYTFPNQPLDKNLSRAQFKTETRAMIAKQGYTIIASIGDQMSDLTGGYVNKTFKLPNPFYFIS